MSTIARISLKLIRHSETLREGLRSFTRMAMGWKVGRDRRARLHASIARNPSIPINAQTSLCAGLNCRGAVLLRPSASLHGLARRNNRLRVAAVVPTAIIALAFLAACNVIPPAQPDAT